MASFTWRVYRIPVRRASMRYSYVFLCGIPMHRYSYAVFLLCGIPLFSSAPGALRGVLSVHCAFPVSLSLSLSLRHERFSGLFVACPSSPHQDASPRAMSDTPGSPRCPLPPASWVLGGMPGTPWALRYDPSSRPPWRLSSVYPVCQALCGIPSSISFTYLVINLLEIYPTEFRFSL